MKIIPGSRRRHYAARIGAFLVTAALIVGMVGCNGGEVYTLTISSNFGGAVITPGEGTFTYSEGRVVDLRAEAEESDHFVSWTGDVEEIGHVNDATTDIIMWENYSITANFAWFNIIQVAAGGGHTVGLMVDDTLVAVGDNYYGQCDVGNWTDITQVAAGYGHTVGLKDDGTVLAMGDNGQCNVGNWTGIAQVAAGFLHTMGLKSDGTVVAVGGNYYGQCNVGNWTGIAQVAAGGSHTVGRKADSTVVAVGYNSSGQCDVGNWTGIAQVAAGWMHTVGLKSDGTVVAVGQNYRGQCDVG